MTYGAAPWTFKGRALYQLQLVKVEEARKHIPEELKLVELWGYTLGGFYLARYDDSPVGAFDELVALAGLVWNAPTSCAWASRVYVNNREARDHGLKSVGLPSRLAAFTMQLPNSSGASKGRSSKQGNWWWQLRSAGAPSAAIAADAVAQLGGSPLQGQLVISNVETARSRSMQMPVCTLTLPAARPVGVWAGPRINMSLPSFSGGTPEYPSLIQYSCDLMTNVRPVFAAAVCVPEEPGSDKKANSSGSELMSAVLGGRPIVALAFDEMVMTVEEPTLLDLAAHKKDTAPRGVLLGTVPPAWGASK